MLQTVNLSSMTSVVRIHHLPPKEPILIRVSVLFWCQVEWIRKPALRNVPVARFNRRGLPVGRQPPKYLMVVPAAKRIHHRTGRQACSSATMGGNNQSRQARARSEGKNRLCSIAKSTCTGYLERYIAVCDVIPSGRTVCAQTAQNHTVRGRTLRLAKSRLRRLFAGRPLRWVCLPLRFSRCR